MINGIFFEKNNHFCLLRLISKVAPPVHWSEVYKAGEVMYKSIVMKLNICPRIQIVYNLLVFISHSKLSVCFILLIYGININTLFLAARWQHLYLCSKN